MVFYQANWKVVSSDVFVFVKGVMDYGKSIREANKTLLVLIPKVNNPETLHNFRPSCLCNVSYKLVTKVIANRLKPLMPELICPNQASFVPGRHIQYNNIIAQEVVHTMHPMKGRRGFMIVKVDLEKAYDRLRWDFFEDTLRTLGLPPKLKDTIMDCITSVSMQVLWNGENTEQFAPSRGIRQGCPLSPYIFVLCISRLSHLIYEAVGLGHWKPIQIGRNGPPLSHLMFADDILLFAEASLDQLRVIMDIMNRFCLVSGQKVSVAKTSIYFSRNGSESTRNVISGSRGFKASAELGRYLGIRISGSRLQQNEA